MKTIWKFAVKIDAPVMMPRDAAVLSVDVQHDTLHVWALVNPHAPLEPRHLKVYGTGHPVPDDPGKFLGTALLAGEALVLHVFEEVSQ